MSNGTAWVDEFVEPAPAGILRAAAWPIETLAGFGSNELARLALEVGDLSGRTLDPGFIGLWRETVERERQLLWSLTADEPRFLKALLFSNRLLYRRVRRCGLRRLGPPTKPQRKLEFTLYRYLARAVGRTAPMGLWAGVSTVAFAAESRQRTTPARYAIAPDLRPFQILLHALATREPYPETAVRNLNPTLQASDGGWEFWARSSSGRIEHRRIDHTPNLATLIDALSDGTRGTWTDLSRHVLEVAMRQPGTADSDMGSARSALEALTLAGALVGGLDLPSRFATAWEALESAEAALADRDRPHWSRSLAALRDICTNLADGLDGMTAEHTEELLLTAEAEVQRLAEALGVPLPAMDYPFLRCDLGLPFDVSCDAVQRRRLVETVRAYEACWIHGASPWTIWRNARRAERQKHLGSGVSLGGLGAEIAESAAGEGREALDTEFRSRLQAWQSTIGAAEDEVVLGLPTGVRDRTLSSPLGCLYVGVQEGFALDVHGLSDDFATSFARFDAALGSTQGLTTWLSRSLRRLEIEHGIEVAQLSAPFEPNPNALARPMLDFPLIEPWGCCRDAETLAEAEIRIEPSTQLPFLWLRRGRHPIAVFSFASANLAATDPVARQLLETSFHEATSGNFRALASALPVELDAPRYAPRISLPSGASIRRRRTVIDGASLRRLTVRSPWQRYIHWQHLAAKYDWPELLNVSLSGQAALSMKRNSPLALDALFKGMRECGAEDFLVVEEFPAAPWLKDVKGGRYVADLALPFARREHGWSSLRAFADRAGGGTR